MSRPLIWPANTKTGADVSKILAFSGSTRSDSFNKKILKAAVTGALNAGAEVTVIDLLDFKLPLYDGDLEASEGIPENGKRLKELFLSHQGLLLALPEYNSSMSGVFKNAIDWVSRPMDNDETLSCFKDKTAAIMSASPGNLGGMRGLVAARSMLGNMKFLVVPDQVCVSLADKAFDANGVLKDENTRLSLEKLGFYLASLLEKIESIPSKFELGKGTDIVPPQHHNNPGLQDQDVKTQEISK